VPMPAPNSEWPPRDLAQPHRDISAWSAWWSGSPDALTEVYGGSYGRTTEKSFDQSAAHRGGVWGSIQRWWWGTPVQQGEQRTKLHLPLASEIASMSADLLYGEPPSITVEDVDATDAETDPTQDALDRLIDERAHTILHDSAESSAALGSKWLRVGIDKAVKPDGPILSLVDADAAFPTFKYGYLTEVLFLSEFAESGAVFWRHFELHRLTAQGQGVVEHALYHGDAHSLGRRMPLDSHPATAALAPLVTELADGSGQGILTGIGRLSVVGGANARSRTWRGIPEARHLGRADISGLEPALDSLDEVGTSLMRDVRHGKSRIHVPQMLLRSGGPGQPASINLDSEVYIGLNSMPSDDKGMEIHAQQFDIRDQKHLAIADALHAEIVEGAGYSGQTFGRNTDTAMTATESWNKQTRTQNTKRAKIRRERPLLLDLSKLLLDMDRTHFGGKGDPAAPIKVQFHEGVSESMEGKARTVQMLRAAGAMSREQAVVYIHPDWDEDQVEAEVDAIADETAASDVPSPLDMFADMEDTPPSDGEGDPEDTAADDTGAAPEGDPDEEADDTAAPGRRPSPFPRRQRTRGGTR
jgi:hypothetical protein